jgi:mRNA interferase MazF
VACRFEGKDGQIVLDQLRTVDKRRLLNHLGKLAPDEQEEVLDVLAAMFAP